MKFSTSSILCLVALFATTIVSSSGQVSARNNDGPSSFGKKVLKKNKSSKAESSTLPLYSMEESSMEESLLTLYGLNRSVSLTKDETMFLEEVIQDAYNKVHEETGDDYFAKSVLIEDDVIDDQSTRSLLRGSSNNNRKLISDQEMCHDENFKVIEGCTFEIDFYIDPYCTHCLFDDEPNMTREPSSVPSRPPTLPPTRDPCNDPNNYRIGVACYDDDDNIGYKNYKNKDSSSDEDEDEDGVVVAEESPPQPFIYPPPPPSTTFDEILRPTVDPMAEIILKKLKKSSFSRFRNVRNVRVSSNNRRYRGGN
jgi:hypothetical protein